MTIELEKLQQDKEEQQIKLLVLKLLHWNGLIAFDASTSVLDEQMTTFIRGKG